MATLDRIGTDTALPPLWDAAPAEPLLRHVYDERAKAVYWTPSTTPACRAKGTDHAVCLLNPGHQGDHYGNGNDRWGALAPKRWR